jgi:hypothetical protein
MTMSKDHICFRMLFFQVSAALFIVSAENFMKILFLTYNVVRAYEHDREHAAAYEGTPQSVQRNGGLHLSLGPLHLCGGLPIRQR